MAEQLRTTFASIDDVKKLWRDLDVDEETRAEQLLLIVSDSLRYEAFKVGQDLDAMIDKNPFLANVAKSVTVDVVARVLMTSTTNEPMTQFSQSALGYSMSGTYLVPGGGLFIKKSELSRLGLRKQKIGTIEMYDQGNNDNSNQ